QNGEPPWAALPADVPAHVVNLLRQCLTRDRTARIADMAFVLFRLNYAAPDSTEPIKPPIPSWSSAIVDGVAAWVQRSPRALRLFSGLARRIAPILVPARQHAFVLGADEVRETLERASDFELGPFGGPKMLMGPFLLGMDPRQQYHDERAVLEQILASLRPRVTTIAREESERQLV